MTTEQRQALEALAEWPDDTDDVMYEAGQDMSPDVDEILRGEQRVDIGIIEDLAHEIMGDFWQP